MPPMYNATHAIGPTLGLAGHQAEYVQALGSGTVFDSMKDRYNAPLRHRVDGTIRFLGSDVGAEVTRHLWAACP